MGLEIDSTGTAMYVRVSERPVDRTRPLEPGLIADTDADGGLVGFEIVGLDKQRVGRALTTISERYGAAAPSLATLAALVA